MDRFYTPQTLADHLVGAVPVQEATVIADFAVGTGSLLNAAVERWPNADVVGTDLDRNALRTLQRRKPEWKLGECDFLNARSRNATKALARSKGAISLVLLNPPFSSRGNSRVTASAYGEQIGCSISAAFLVNAVDFLATGGIISAILPAAFLTSEKDREARAVLSELGSLEAFGRQRRDIFAGCFPRTVLMRFHLGGTSASTPEPRTYDPERGVTVRMVRGNSAMHKLDQVTGRPVRFAHTTELVDNCVRLRQRPVLAASRSVVGPVLLLPRVGEPNSKKLAIYNDSVPLFLSDCIIGLECDDLRSAQNVYNRLIEGWASFEALYGGTGARYITISQLTEWLSGVGIQTM